MPRGGKRPGAGRPKKPSGHAKEAWYNARISAELRDLLQKWADSKNRSLAREIELRLEKSIQDDRFEQWGDAQNFAIARLVGTLAQYANGSAYGHWRSNRFAFECFREALQHTMQQLSDFVPKEPNDAPSEIKASCAGNPELACWLDPGNIGRAISFGLLREVRKPRPPITSDFPDVFHSLPHIGELLKIPSGGLNVLEIAGAAYVAGTITDK